MWLVCGVAVAGWGWGCGMWLWKTPPSALKERGCGGNGGGRRRLAAAGAIGWHGRTGGGLRETMVKQTMVKHGKARV